MRKERDRIKVIRTIQSCISYEQLSVANALIDVFQQYYDVPVMDLRNVWFTRLSHIGGISPCASK